MPVQGVIPSLIIYLGATTLGYGTGTQTGVEDTTGRYAGTYLLFF